MTQRRRTTAVLLAGTLAVAASACGGGSCPQAAKSTTATGTTAAGTTATQQKTTSTKAKRPSLAATPAKTLTFTGVGVKELGVVRIPTNSTIKWTNDGALFQIIPASAHVPSPVNSREHSGEAKIRRGAYHGFLINAIGHWTVTIVPGG